MTYVHVIYILLALAPMIFLSRCSNGLPLTLATCDMDSTNASIMTNYHVSGCLILRLSEAYSTQQATSFAECQACFEQQPTTFTASSARFEQRWAHQAVSALASVDRGGDLHADVSLQSDMSSSAAPGTALHRHQAVVRSPQVEVTSARCMPYPTWGASAIPSEQPEGRRRFHPRVTRRWFARLRYRSIDYSDGTMLTVMALQSHYHML